ncbi:hypothetical protein HY634_02315 [Candidatus Uhrbacteria bacterium]|nr:hypothetical protein [Candidatus Uhrbacteria bacterium]
MLELFNVRDAAHPRVDFRQWATGHFPYFSGAPGSHNDANRSHAIAHRAVLLTAARDTVAWTNEHSGPSIRTYYAEDTARIQRASEGGSDDDMLFAIDALLGSIEWE